MVIDLFGQDELAQILHVTHDGTEAKVQTISTYLHKKGILQDLDVRASDLLQSNAVIWVEGPSDRIYLNRWIGLWDPELQEGVHYHCLYSGGGLVEGMSFDDPLDELGDPSERTVQELIAALKINRHSIIMMDRDREEGEELKPWVTRIQDELEGMGGVPWITAGRTVENYIPLDLAHLLVSQNKATLKKDYGAYDDFFKCFRGPKNGDVSGSKVRLAYLVCEHLTKEHLETTLDLSEKVDAVCVHLRLWNGMTPRRS